MFLKTNGVYFVIFIACINRIIIIIIIIIIARFACMRIYRKFPNREFRFTLRIEKKTVFKNKLKNKCNFNIIFVQFPYKRYKTNTKYPTCEALDNFVYIYTLKTKIVDNTPLLIKLFHIIFFFYGILKTIEVHHRNNHVPPLLPVPVPLRSPPKSSCYPP